MEAGVPVAPAWLDKDAKAEYERVCPHLEGMGCVSPADRAHLEKYAKYYSLWRKCVDGLTDGRKFTLGSMEHRRVSSTAAEACGLWTHAADALGLSPAARTRLHTPDAQTDEKDEKARFFQIHAG